MLPRIDDSSTLSGWCSSKCRTVIDFWEHHPENVELFYFLEILISTGEKEEKKKREEGKGNKEEDEEEKKEEEEAEEEEETNLRFQCSCQWICAN